MLESLSVPISPLAGSSNDVNKLLACTIHTKFSSVLMTPRFWLVSRVFIAAALDEGNPAIVWATESHRDALIQRLRTRGVEIDAAIQRGTYIASACCSLW